jgi:hypothetical protein
VSHLATLPERRLRLLQVRAGLCGGRAWQRQRRLGCRRPTLHRTVGRAMVLVAAPDEELAALLADAPGMRQDELKQRVAALNVVRNVPVRSVDSRRIMEALRLLSMVRLPLADEDHGLMVQVKAVVDGLVHQDSGQDSHRNSAKRSGRHAAGVALVGRRTA